MMKDSDKELLEYAAKAAGIEIFSYQQVGNKTGWPITDIGLWNPLLDDCDALRLAFKLRIDIEFNFSNVNAHLNKPGFGYSAEERIINYDISTTRRAICRAAAEFGKANHDR